MATELDRQEFRAVMGHFATGVAVVTGMGEAGPTGLTANALASLSLEPLLLLVCFDNDARTLSIVRAAGRFGVNVLRSDQEALAGVFASKRSESEKFDGVGYRVEDGVPILEHALAWLVCELDELVPRGDHTIAIGAVRSMGHEPGEPLVWFRGGFGSLG